MLPRTRHAAAIAVMAAAMSCSQDPDAWRRCTGDDARDHVHAQFASAADVEPAVESLREDDRLAAVLTESPASLYALPRGDLPAGELAEQLEAELSKATSVEIIRCR